MKITRRKALQLAAMAGGSAVLLPIAHQYTSHAATALSPQIKPFTINLSIPPVLEPVRRSETTDYYEITIKRNYVEILPGLTTQIWGYNGIVPGPTIKQHQGRQSVVRFINDVGASTSTHLHGMASLPQFDGYAEDLSRPGFYKDYHYPNNSAATFWYHDHAIDETAHHVYMGLAGMYIVQDDLELSLPLPKGEYDIPLIIDDKILKSDGALVFDDDHHTSLMGDIILVNGIPFPKFEVANRKYRFRVLNGSVSRSYKLALSTGEDLIVIGSDGGLLNAPVRTKDLRIGMGERYELIIDFSKYALGTQIVLQNLGLPNNIDYEGTSEIMRFDVVRAETDNSSIPSTLRFIPPLEPPSPRANRRWTFEKRNDRWEINGNIWDKNRIDANPGLNDIEVWEIITNSRDWFHPVHIHLVHFQILERNGQPPLAYERGWKDIVYIGEDDNIKLIAQFAPHPGKYMMHCHNTVHEDHAMMTQFEVASGGIDPMSAPPLPLPAPPL